MIPPLHAYHCTSCDTPIFRTATHGRTGRIEFTYPLPDSVYARMRNGASASPGIGYCAAHVPPLGGDVLGLETAGLRYANWYTSRWGQHFASWLQDHMELPEHEVAALVAQWQEDVKATEGVHA